MNAFAYHVEAGGWGIYPLVACYAAVVLLAFDRAVAFMRHGGPSVALTGRIALHLREGDLGGALGVSAASFGACARIATRILREGLGAPERASAARDEALACEEPRLKRRLALFGSLAQISTLLGLLGTLTGLATGSCPTTCDATSRATMLAKGISESLNCCAGGLFVTMIALASHVVFRISFDRCVATMRAESKAVVNLLAANRERIRLFGHRPYIEPMGYRRAA